VPLPQVSKPDEKEREKTADEMILSLKLAYLMKLLFGNPGMKLFFLNKNTIAIETGEFYF